MLEKIKTSLRHPDAVISPASHPTDARLIRTVGAVICVGFVFILAFNSAHWSVERNRVMTAQSFEGLTNANFELGTISQRITLLLFGMLNPRDNTLQGKLSEEVQREIASMENAEQYIRNQLALSVIELSPEDRKNLAGAAGTSRRFVSVSRNLLEVILAGKVDRGVLGQFADLASSVLAASRAAVESLSGDAVKSARRDEALKLILFTLTTITTVLTGVVVILFVMLRLKRALESRRSTESQLLRANKDLEKFSSIVAHDLKGPLNNIALCVKMLEEKTSGVSEIREMTQMIGNQTRRLGAMVQALLCLSRTQNSPLTVSVINIKELIEEVKLGIRSRLEASSATVQYRGLERMLGDRALIQSLFQNLIENSLRYCREGVPPAVDILASHQRGYIQFIYEDNGRGIPLPERDHVFEPFVQLDSGKAGQGLGLGLSVVKRIVMAHGGRTFIADREGPGTRFVILIPRRISRPGHEKLTGSPGGGLAKANAA